VPENGTSFKSGEQRGIAAIDDGGKHPLSLHRMRINDLAARRR
jgi:hypothetical protein